MPYLARMSVMQLDTGSHRPILRRLPDGRWHVVDRALPALPAAQSPADAAGAAPAAGARAIHPLTQGNPELAR